MNIAYRIHVVFSVKVSPADRIPWRCIDVGWCCNEQQQW